MSAVDWLQAGCCATALTVTVMLWLVARSEKKRLLREGRDPRGDEHDARFAATQASVEEALRAHEFASQNYVRALELRRREIERLTREAEMPPKDHLQ